MKIHLNQIFSTEETTDYISWKTLTKGRFENAIDRFKGIPYFKEVRSRTPAIEFHNNPYREDKEQSPWRDIILQDEGIVIYNGDNKSSKIPAHLARGNKRILKVLKFYSSRSREDRLLAPPIIVTRTVMIGGKTGYREFIGVGLISRNIELIQQYEKGSNRVFSNYRFTVTLLSLLPDEYMDWKWVDDRRDKSITTEDSLRHAPECWKRWVNEGEDPVAKIQLKIKPYRIISVEEQRNIPSRNRKILEELLTKFYPDPTKDGIRFEAMASFIASLYFERFNYNRGWITEGTGDRGVDFVGKLDIGQDDFSKTSLIVLGQSKRYKNSISGERLTRVASRMNRGYIGMVVTLDTFTIAAQAEIRDDKLPIILVNGNKVSEILLNYMNRTNKSLEQIVLEQDKWSENNLLTDHYETILNL